MVSLKVSLLLLIAVCTFSLGTAKVYDRCEFFRELRDKRYFPPEQLPTWVCIAYTVSGLNTAATSGRGPDGSTNHGIFQINDRYWCSPGPACGVTCNELKTDNIAKSVMCARQIYAEGKRMRNNGFSAWDSYQHCNSPEKVYPLITGC